MVLRSTQSQQMELKYGHVIPLNTEAGISVFIAMAGG